MKTLRVATLQLNPKIGAVTENINRANTILSQTFPSTKSSHSDRPDLLILPELGLTGYNYSSPSHIQPYLESPSKLGPTLTWAKEISLKYRCFTVLGYPETATDSKIYNSAIVFNKEGEILHNYRKSFLYETDETWGASEGQGFKAFQLADGIKATIGICMDLNPYKFEAPFQKFEFSKFCRDNETNLIICPTAWLHSGSPSIAEGITSEEKKQLREKLQQDIAIEHNKEFVSDIDRGEITEYETVKDFEKLNEPDYGTLNYWILRFFPFVHQFWKPNTLPHKTTVILNNRSGIEDDVLYCGSSTILQFYGSDRPETFGFTSTYFENQNVKVLGALGKGNEGILVRNIEI